MSATDKVKDKVTSVKVKTTTTVKKATTTTKGPSDAELQKAYDLAKKKAEAELKIEMVTYDACKDKVKCQIAIEDLTAKTKTISGSITTSDSSPQYKDCTDGKATFDFTNSAIFVVVNKAATV